MGFRRDDRAQAIQIGAVLIFGILIVGLSIYQVTVVPQQNKEIEFNGYLDASDDMTGLRSDLIIAAGRGVQSPTTVKTGVRYPARTLFVNPGPTSSRLSTTSSSNVTLSGVTATSGEPPNAQRVWDGSPRNFSTRGVLFDPGYNVFEGDPVVTTGAAVYRLTGNGPIALTGQSLVSGNRITLVTVEGNLSAGGDTVAVTAEPVSTSTDAIIVTGTGSTFNLTLPTPTNATAWNDTVVADALRANPNVQGVTVVSPTAVNVTFDGSRAYELRVARVEVKARSDSESDSEPPGEYVVAATGNGSSSAVGAPTRLTAEVRDRYGNPDAGENVTFSTSDGTFSVTGTGTRTVTTTDSGLATVSFVPGSTGTVTVDAQFAGSTAPLNQTTFEVQVPSGTSSLSLTEANPNATDDDWATVSFENTGSAPVQLTGFRVVYYDTDGNPTNSMPSSAALEGNGTDTATIGDYSYEPIDQTIVVSGGSTRPIDIEFTGSPQIDTDGDFFVLGVELDGTVEETFFVAIY